MKTSFHHFLRSIQPSPVTPRSAQSGRGSQSVLSHRRTARFFGLALLVCLHFFAATICEAIVIAWDARNDNGEWDSIESPVGGNGTDNWTFGIPGEDDTALFADEYLINPIRTIDLVDNQAVDAVFLQGVGQYTLGTVVGAETLTIGEGSDAGGVSLGSVSAVAGDALSILNCNVAMNDTSGDNVFAVSVTDQRKLSINGIVSGSNALRKRGWGTLTLSNANSYSGGTIIAEGTLIAANTAGSATGAGSVKVEALSHLSGTGRIGGAITVDANGTIAPGNSIGTLTALAGVTLNGTYACEIGGGSADQLAVTGTLDVRNATLDLSELSVPTGTSYTIATATQVQGPFAAVTGLRTGLSITYSSTSIVIERSPVLYVDAAAAPGGSGTSWGSTSALDTLDEALAYAIPGDQIWVKEGVYTPGEGSSDPASTFDVPDGIQLLGGFAGTETTASQRDPAAHPTILSGDLGNDDFTNVDGITISPAWIRGTNAYSVVTVSFSAPVIDGFVITGGSAPLTSIGNPGGESRGGGVFIDTDFAHVPTLSNCRFYGNAAVQGGAIFVHSYGGAEIESCDFRSNSATGRGGAAYYWWSNITTTNSNFSGNHAGDDGGAIFDDPQDKGSTIYVNCTITGNSSVDKGGGISNSTSATTVREMHNTLIWNNQAQGTSSTSNSSLSGSAGYDFSHCLVQHVDLTDSGTNNLDGTDAGNDPGFFFPLDPSKAPRMSGDFTFAKPTGMATIQGNNQRFFVAEKDGIVWEFPDIGSATPGRSVFMDFTDPAWRAQAGGELDQWIEMGVKGFTFHPQFENGSPYVFVAYNFEAGAPSSAIGTARVSRFTSTSNGAGPVDMLSEVVLLELDNVAGIHNIDGAEFGPDGYLYVGFGDDANPGLHSQTITNQLWSSIIRIDVDRKPGNLEPNPAPFVMTDGGGQAYYKIPVDNPYAATSGTVDYNGSSFSHDAVRSEIYVSGARNPWRFSFDNIGGTPVIWYGDIGSGGSDSREEINIVRNGDNAGWMMREGGDRTQIFVDGDGNTVTGPAGRIYSNPGPGVTLRDPEFFYARGSGPYEGASVTGGYVTRSGRYLSLDGKYIFGDWLNGHLWSLERTATEGEPIVTRIGGMASPTAFIEDPSNGDILVLSWNSEAGGLFASGGQVGRVFRIQQEVASDGGLPEQLSDTGIFADLFDLSPNPGLLAYDPLVTFWSDNALKRRWMAVPEGTIGFSQDDPWQFPTGSVFVKHFDMELRRGDPTSAKRLETRVLVKNDDGVYGVSYRWNESGTSASLVPDAGESFDLQIDDDNNPSTPDITQTWTIPSRTQCNVCHNSEADHVLGINTRQLNHSAGPMFGQFGNQLELLEQFGMLDGYTGPASSLPAHARIEDGSASVDARARTYLEVNCAYCHREDGGFHLGAHLTLAEMNVLGHPDTGHNTSSNPNLERIRMGHPEDSTLLQRTQGSPGFNRMPPLGSALIDEAGVQLLTAWIQELDPAQPLDNEDVVDLALKGPGGTFVGEDDAAITGFEEDPDADGIANGIEVLLGLDPDSRDQVQILTHEVVEDGGQNFFEVELVLSDEFADQLDWKIQWSDELGGWADSFTSTTTVSVAEGKRTVRVRDTRSLDGATPSRFYRLSLDGADLP